MCTVQCDTGGQVYICVCTVNSDTGGQVYICVGTVHSDTGGQVYICVQYSVTLEDRCTYVYVHTQ